MMMTGEYAVNTEAAFKKKKSLSHTYFQLAIKEKFRNMFVLSALLLRSFIQNNFLARTAN